MDISLINLIPLLMAASTPILLAGLGELVVEKSGVLNLGVEGMMIIGAIAGFMTAVSTGSPTLGFIGGAVGGGLLAVIFAVLTQFMMSNQVATGLALTLFGLGFSALLGQNFVGLKPPPTPALHIPVLSDLPVIGRMFFQHDAMVYVSLLAVLGVWITLRFTRAGLVLRAVGENHGAAHALGYKVVRIRFAAIAFGGAMAGLGGAYLSLVRVPQWTDGMTAGAGWIALALVVFAAWRPFQLLVGAYLFGGITVLQLNMQAAGVNVPVELLSMSPYLVTILVLVLMSARANVSAGAPGSLGKAFHAAR